MGTNNGLGQENLGVDGRLAFAPDPLGTASADEWFWGASWLRFNPVTTLDASTTEIFMTAAEAAGAFSPTEYAEIINSGGSSGFLGGGNERLTELLARVNWTFSSAQLSALVRCAATCSGL